METFDFGEAIKRIKRAAFHAQDEQWAAAIPDYDRAIEIDPGRASYHYHRGVARRHATEVDDTAGLESALADFDRSLELDPEGNPSRVHFWRGDTLEDLTRFEAARAAFERAVELDPDNWEALEGRARMRLGAGDEAGAAEDYDRADQLRAKEELFDELAREAEEEDEDLDDASDEEEDDEDWDDEGEDGDDEGSEPPF